MWFWWLSVSPRNLKDPGGMNRKKDNRRGGQKGHYTVHGILQATILEWVTFPFSRESSQPRDRTQVSSIAGAFFTSWTTKEAPEGSLWGQILKGLISLKGLWLLTRRDEEPWQGLNRRETSGLVLKRSFWQLFQDWTVRVQEWKQEDLLGIL